jgi:sec-independent protein translocase protein TatC
VLLVLTGMVNIEKLRQSRGYVLIGIFILAALLTPPDVLSQCSLAIPMYLLYEGGILMASMLSRARSAEAGAKVDER